MQRECNVVSFGELTRCIRLEKKEMNYTKIQNRRCRRSVQLLNIVDVESDLHKRLLPSQHVLQQIPRVFTTQYFNSSYMNLTLETFKLDKNKEMCQIKPKEE